jgi:hypothetical protein
MDHIALNAAKGSRHIPAPTLDGIHDETGLALADEIRVIYAEC